MVAAQDQNNNTTSYADQYQPPSATDSAAAPKSTASVSSTPESSTEELERQNIFEMLGVSEGSDEQKEEFLDELQHVIWEDFIENDVPLLITSSEAEQLKTIRAKEYDSQLAQQEAIVEFLEKLIPDMEDIMLEKALELKADLFRERIAILREDFADNASVLATVDQAEAAMQQNKWQTATKTLNQVSY